MTNKLGIGKKIAVTAVGAVAVGVPMISSAQAANAAPSGLTEYNNSKPGTPVGNMGDQDGKAGYLFGDLTQDGAPLFKSGGIQGTMGSYWHKDGKTTLWCVSYGIPQGGIGGPPTSTLRDSTAKEANYIINKYQGTVTPANHAAISLAIHKMRDDGTGPNGEVVLDSIEKSDQFKATNELAEKYISEAKKNSGPYTSSVAVTPEGKVTASLKSASGNDVTGFSATFKVSDNAVFDMNGNGKIDDGESSTFNGKIGDKIPNLLMKSAAGGQFKVTMNVDNLPGDDVRYWNQAGSQKMIAVGSSDKTSASAEATVEDTRVWSPKVTTKTSDAFAVPGKAISDTIEVAGNKDGNPLEVTSKLYYSQTPIKESDKVPAGAKEVGSVKTTVKGNGTFKTPEVKVGDGGYYVWVESIPATTIPTGGTTKAWNGKYGVASEITVVGNVATKASDDVEVGQKMFDTATVTGAVPEGSYLSFDLYRVSDKALTDDEVEAQKANLAKQFTKENLVWSSENKVEVKGPGEYKSAETTVKDAGTYSYVETLHDKEGKVLVKGGTPVGKESVIVKEKPVTPPPAPSGAAAPKTPAPQAVHTGNEAENNSGILALIGGGLASIGALAAGGFGLKRKFGK